MAMRLAVIEVLPNHLLTQFWKHYGSKRVQSSGGYGAISRRLVAAQNGCERRKCRLFRKPAQGCAPISARLIT